MKSKRESIGLSEHLESSGLSCHVATTKESLDASFDRALRWINLNNWVQSGPLYKGKGVGGLNFDVINVLCYPIANCVYNVL